MVKLQMKFDRMSDGGLNLRLKTPDWKSELLQSNVDVKMKIGAWIRELGLKP